MWILKLYKWIKFYQYHIGNMYSYQIFLEHSRTCVGSYKCSENLSLGSRCLWISVEIVCALILSSFAFFSSRCLFSCSIFSCWIVSCFFFSSTCFCFFDQINSEIVIPRLEFKRLSARRSSAYCCRPPSRPRESSMTCLNLSLYVRRFRTVRDQFACPRSRPRSGGTITWPGQFRSLG